MAQVSERFMRDDVQQQMQAILALVITRCTTTADVDSFLTLFLTPTQRITITKRVAIAYLLLKGEEYRSIEERLRVSTATIGDVAIRLRLASPHETGLLRTIVDERRSQKEWDELLASIDEALITVPGRNWKQARQYSNKKRRELIHRL